MNAENAYTEGFMNQHKGFVDNLYKEMLGRIKQDDASACRIKKANTGITRKPKKANNIRFISRSKTKDGKDAEVLLDQNEMAEGLQIFLHR